MTLDDELNAMLVYARGQVRDYFGEDLWDASIDWDRGCVKDSETLATKEMREIFKDAEVSHSIGFICGVATALDMTPLELLDHVTDRGPARTMTGARLLSIPLKHTHRRGMRDAATPPKPRRKAKRK